MPQKISTHLAGQQIADRQIDDRQIHSRLWLIKLRGHAGLSQEGLARRLNVSLSAVQKWEAGRPVPHNSREAIALELGDEVLDHFHAEDVQSLKARRLAQGAA